MRVNGTSGESDRLCAVWGSRKLGVAIVAAAGALAVAAPASASRGRPHGSLTITQNPAYVVVVTPVISGAIAAVSWGDVSWSDMA